MDTIKHYQGVIKQVLKNYAEFLNLPPLPPYQVAVAFDDIHQQYLVCKVGWTKKQRINKTIIHVAIYDGKIWIEEDWTEEGIAASLIRYGIPKEDIVLGFQPPQFREVSISELEAA